MNLTPIDADNRIQLPSAWMESLGMRRVVALERTGDGILIRPCPRTTWEDIFATKLAVGSAPPDQTDEAVEATGDDFLF
jgi:hypothetical protein